MLNKAGRNLRGGQVIDTERKKIRVKLRFGKGNEKFKVHAYLNNRYQESISLQVRYNKVVGIVTEVYNGVIHDIELYEVEDTGYTSDNTVAKDTQNYLGGEPNDAYELFYDVQTPANIILDGVGGSGTGMQKAGGIVRFSTKTKPFSPKYYPSKFSNLDGFRGNQHTIVRQFTKIGKTFGKAGNVGTLIIGGADIYINYEAEEGFGEKTQQATGSLAGSAGGAYIGGLIGAAFGGVGAIPGAIVGGIIGGYFWR